MTLSVVHTNLNHNIAAELLKYMFFAASACDLGQIGFYPHGVSSPVSCCQGFNSIPFGVWSGVSLRGYNAKVQWKNLSVTRQRLVSESMRIVRPIAVPGSMSRLNRHNVLLGPDGSVGAEWLFFSSNPGVVDVPGT